MKQGFLKTAKAAGLFALARKATARKLRILCYHGIWFDGPPLYGDYLFMKAETFARRMSLLRRLGYPLLPLEEAVRRLRDGTLPPAAVAVTIDDGWYGTYSHMLPELERHGIPATIYVTTHYVLKERPVLNILVGFMVKHARPGPRRRRDLLPDGPDETVDLKDPRLRDQVTLAIYERLDAMPDIDQRWCEVQRLARLLAFDLDQAVRERRFDLMRRSEIRDAHDRGFDIQLHSHRHRLRGFVQDRVVSEIEENRQHLSEILDVPPVGLNRFCFPSGNWTPALFPALRAAGITQATTTDFGLNDAAQEPYALKRILDGESLSDLDFEARLSGFWNVIEALKEKRSGYGGRG